jgi:hypothetical protein
MTQPLSAFSRGEKNAASFAIAQHQINIDNAIAYIIGLYEDDIEVLEDNEIFRSVIKKYNLTNISKLEEDYIVKSVLNAAVREEAL